MVSEKHQPIYEIAAEIEDDWKNVNYGARPYLNAMHNIDQITDFYFRDPADMIVRYFLANASSWRGQVARDIKKQLKIILMKA